MEQVDRQGVPSHGAEETDGHFPVLHLGETGHRLPVEPPSQRRSQQEKPQVGKQREIVAGGKPARREPQGDQHRRHIRRVPPQHQSRGSEGQSRGNQHPIRQLPEQRPQQHTHAQAVQHAEINQDAPVRHAGKIQQKGRPGAQKAAAEDRQSPPDAAAAQGDADAGDHQKNSAEVILKNQIPLGQLPVQDAEQVHQIVNKVDDHHPQQRRAPGEIQLPDPLFHTPSAALASSSSTR